MTIGVRTARLSRSLLPLLPSRASTFSRALATPAHHAEPSRSIRSMRSSGITTPRAGSNARSNAAAAISNELSSDFPARLSSCRSSAASACVNDPTARSAKSSSSRVNGRSSFGIYLGVLSITLADLLFLRPNPGLDSPRSGVFAVPNATISTPAGRAS